MFTKWSSPNLTWKNHFCSESTKACISRQVDSVSLRFWRQLFILLLWLIWADSSVCQNIATRNYFYRQIKNERVCFIPGCSLILIVLFTKLKCHIQNSIWKNYFSGKPSCLLHTKCSFSSVTYIFSKLLALFSCLIL